MAYNLPPGWDPGFVLPENVRDEGLERRAFVTKQLPRGTYDNPSVGTGGYMVPQYVLDEDYGQGAFTTKWKPSGTYDGGAIPDWLAQRPRVTRTKMLPGNGRQVTIAMGDDGMPEPFASYGQRAAQALLARVAQLPTEARKTALKAVMDRVDKSLWPRTEQIWRDYVKRGMSPGDALPRALARAMSAGIAAEIITTGLRRSAPQAKSLLGLGCYGCFAALGEDGSAPVACQSVKGYSWVYAAGSVPGHWQRTPVGQQDVPFCPGGPPTGAVTVDTTTADVREHRDTDLFFVGPFGFSASKLAPRAWGIGDPSSTTTNIAGTPDIMYVNPDFAAVIPPQPAGSPVKKITPEVLKWLSAQLTTLTDPLSGKSDKAVHYTDASGAYGYPEADAVPWFNAMGIAPTTPVRLHVLWDLRTGIQPFAKSKHPKTGHDLVLHVQLARLKRTEVWNATTNPTVLKVWLSEVPDPGFFGDLWGVLTFIPAALIPVADLIVEAAGDLADLACGLLNSPVAGAAGAVAATAAGVPPQVGVKGIDIAKGACGTAPPPVTVPAAVATNWPLILALGGAAVASVVILTTPKKGTSS